MVRSLSFETSVPLHQHIISISIAPSDLLCFRHPRIRNFLYVRLLLAPWPILPFINKIYITVKGISNLRRQYRHKWMKKANDESSTSQTYKTVFYVTTWKIFRKKLQISWKNLNISNWRKKKKTLFIDLLITSHNWCMSMQSKFHDIKRYFLNLQSHDVSRFIFVKLYLPMVCFYSSSRNPANCMLNWVFHGACSTLTRVLNRMWREYLVSLSLKKLFD